MSTDDSIQPNEGITVNVNRLRSGHFCIRIQWETPKKELRQLDGVIMNANDLVNYSTEFKIENQSCRYQLKATFLRRFNQIECTMKLIRTKGREDNESRPSAISVFINGEETNHKFTESWDWDRWHLHLLNADFACPDGIDFGDISWETTNENEWKPLTCLLWIEFETFNVREKNALKQLTELYVQQIQCDVQFSFDDDEEIGGHSHILAARSPVFAAVFQHEMKEKTTGQVYIEDIKPDIFKELLHYIYSGRLLTPLTEASAQPLFVAADKYDIGDLKEDCVDFLLAFIRVDNVINLMAWAHIHSIEELKEEALEFTSLHGKEISPLKDWENLMKNYPEVCLEATRRIINRMSLIFEFVNL